MKNLSILILVVLIGGGIFILIMRVRSVGFLLAHMAHMVTKEQSRLCRLCHLCREVGVLLVFFIKCVTFIPVHCRRRGVEPRWPLLS